MSTRSRTQYISVEVDISEFDDDIILEEAKSRNLDGHSDSSSEIMEMFYAFKLGKTDRAMELAKQIASEYMGAII